MENGAVKRYLGLTWLLWGDGKGKTTAAIGAAVRALGHGLRVHLIQFLKAGPSGGGELSGELKILNELPGFSSEQHSAEDWVAAELSDDQQAALERAVWSTRQVLSSGDHDLVILDEVLYAVSLGGISAATVLDLLRHKAPHTEVILTGGWSEVPELIPIADLVTEMKKVKHPFDLGIAARKGVEY